MSFADGTRQNGMQKRFEELTGETNSPSVESRNPSICGVRTNDPVNHAIQQIHKCIVNQQVPVVFIIEHASQLLSGPTGLSVEERMLFLRMLQSASESQEVGVGSFPNKRVVRNLLMVVCEKLTDIPAWLYLKNPYGASIEVEQPRSYERKCFFETSFIDPPVQGNSAAPEHLIDDLVDLTDGMSIRDLVGIGELARTQRCQKLSTKALIDYYKYGNIESEWDNLDLTKLSEENAEPSLSEKVIGQPAAVAAVADVLRRARLNLSGMQHSGRGKPRGILFFAGPTGVGKTEMAKAVAKLIFNDEDACKRFDMSEYSASESDQRLFGAPPGYIGYEEGGQLTNTVRTNPFSVLLFDEIEKADPTILDKFLQILEDGRLTDGKGETVYFSESIIIFTSNAGIYRRDPTTQLPELHVDPNKLKNYADVKAAVIEGVKEYFTHILRRPEILNRIGENIIVFDFIREPMMLEILNRKMLPEIRRQIEAQLKVVVEFGPEVSNDLMRIVGNRIEHGGRGIGNIVESAVLNPLAREIYRRKILNDNENIAGETLRIDHVYAPSAGTDHRYRIELS